MPKARSLVGLDVHAAGGPSAADGVTITSVERDDLGIRVTYDSVAPVGFGTRSPRAEAKDDLGNHYNGLGGHFGLARGGWRGGLTMPLPPAAATMLRIRITWAAHPSSIWRDQRTKCASLLRVDRSAATHPPLSSVR